MTTINAGGHCKINAGVSRPVW